MPTPPKPTGRIIRDLATDIVMLAHDGIDASTEPLGSTDPVEFQKAAKKVIRILQRIATSANEIGVICEKDALRGPYNQKDSE